MTFEPRSAGIIGLGLIGGSLARELAGRGVRVAGFDANSATLDAACAEGVVGDRLDGSLEGLNGLPVVIVATPVSVTERALATAAAKLGSAALVMDVGSTKRSVVAAAESLGLGDRFVGAHPMAGSHRSGWEASRAGLFVDAPVFLCATRTTRASALECARELWTALGARVETLDAGVHDRTVALTSHLPHAAVAALTLAIADAGMSRRHLGPGGRDALRIAASSPDLWADIMLDNADELLGALSGLEKQLAVFRQAIVSGDRERMRALFAAAREWSDA